MSKQAPEERYCANCRAEIGQGESVCPACGVYAGDVFDGRIGPPRRRWIFWLAAIGMMALVFAGLWLLTTPRPAHRRTATDSAHAPVPAGPVRSEAQAARRLIAVIAGAKGIAAGCVALLHHGTRDARYVFTATDACRHVNLGRWTVAARDGGVHRDR